MAPIKHINIDEKICLTEIRQTDGQYFVRYANNADVYQNTLTFPKEYTQEKFEVYYKIVKDSEEKFGFQTNWAIRLKDEAGTLIGGIGLIIPELERERHRFEFGYWIGEPFRNKGIVTKIVKIFADFCFAEFPIIRLQAGAFTTNPASARVLEKAGFEKEGVLYNFSLKDGAPRDVVMFSKIRK